MSLFISIIQTLGTMNETKSDISGNQSEDGLIFLDIHKTVKKRVNDRFIHSRQWSERKRNDCNIDETEKVQNRTPTP